MVTDNSVVGSILGIQLIAIDKGLLTGTTVKGNTVVGNLGDGIQVVATQGGNITNSHIVKNKVLENLSVGILLDIDGTVDSTLTGVLVERDKAIGNGASGIVANTGVGVNNINRNKSDLNVGWGYEDAGGTNIYTGNKCNLNGLGGSNPGGLCTP